MSRGFSPSYGWMTPLAAVERALALKPDDATSLRVRFLVQHETGNHAEAEAALAAYGAIEADAAIELLSGWAETDFREGRRRRAAVSWLRVLAIEPDLAEAHPSWACSSPGTIRQGHASNWSDSSRLRPRPPRWKSRSS